MKNEEQFIALLEWMGWVLEPAGKDSFGVYYAAFWRHTQKPGVHVLPPLTLDLMHEAVSKLTVSQKRSFSHYLQTIVLFVDADTTKAIISFSPEGDFHDLDEDFACENATKEQRLEALLKTIGKYEL